MIEKEWIKISKSLKNICSCRSSTSSSKIDQEPSGSSTMGPIFRPINAVIPIVSQSEHEEMERHKLGSDSYYTILGVGSDCSAEEIRRAYRRLAMVPSEIPFSGKSQIELQIEMPNFGCVAVQRWHPDRWARRRAAPALLSNAKAKFQQIQQAYSGNFNSLTNPKLLFLLCSWLIIICFDYGAVLSDQRKRALYDAGFYNDEDDDDDEHNEVSIFIWVFQNLIFSFDSHCCSE